MSEIIGMVGMSHSPFATMLPPTHPAAPGGRFLADTARVAAAVAGLAPDALVVIGPDHFHANFYDVMPPFVLGVGETDAFGDFDSRSGPLPVAPALAWAIRDGLAGDGFDIALSYALTVDHGIVQSYEMVRGQTELPIVPLVVNAAAPPLPSMPRCVTLGRSLGAAVRAADAGRVLIVASGGLSHWLPSNDPRDTSVSAERRDSVIHGRHDVRAFAATREPAVVALAGNPDAPVNADWDSWFLKQLAAAELGPVTSLGDEGLEERAGSGGHEIRTWLIGLAAAARPLVWTSYEPVPEWVTGMGIGTTFEVALCRDLHDVEGIPPLSRHPGRRRRVRRSGSALW
jgi:2,3-dihydroxyphenylpropionate 1,2-dioxygenase